MSYCIKTLKPDQLDVIRPLWKQLNTHHIKYSQNFKQYYKTQTFESRCAKFAMLPKEHIRIDVLTDTKDNPYGYCISTVNGVCGEIDSLYIAPECRKAGHGDTLMQSALTWLRQQGCSEISVTVADGNEHVFPFYKRSGFYVRKTILQLK